MNFKIVTKLAWRSVWRNRRRTILTFTTVFIGCGMVIWMNAWAKGAHDQMINDLISMNTGHIQIHEKGYWDNQTIDYAFQPQDRLIKEISRNPNIAGHSERVHAGGLISFKDNTSGTFIQAVEPEQEKKVSDIYKRILPGGSYLQKNGMNQIILGETLAKNLQAETGSEIALISQGFDGSIAAGKFTVAGIFRTGNPEYDRGLAIMNLSRAKEMFYMSDYIHSICIRLNRIDQLEQVKTELSAFNPDGRLEIMGWDRLMPEIVQFIKMDDVSAYIFDFILLMIVAFTMLNTIQMSVFERTREFGVMLSIGTRPSQVVSMVILESFFISLIGVISGILLGWSLSYYFMIHPMDYTEYARELSTWGITTTLFPADASALNITVTSIFTFASTIIFSIFPAFKASRLNPVDAIRHL